MVRKVAGLVTRARIHLFEAGAHTTQVGPDLLA